MIWYLCQEFIAQFLSFCVKTSEPICLLKVWRNNILHQRHDLKIWVIPLGFGMNVKWEIEYDFGLGLFCGNSDSLLICVDTST